jgi:hypothetical protein
MATVFEPIRPVPPMTTISMVTSVVGDGDPLGRVRVQVKRPGPRRACTMQTREAAKTEASPRRPPVAAHDVERAEYQINADAHGSFRPTGVGANDHAKELHAVFVAQFAMAVGEPLASPRQVGQAFEKLAHFAAPFPPHRGPVAVIGRAGSAMTGARRTSVR